MLKKILISLMFCSITAVAQEKIELFFDFDQYSLNEAAVKKLDVWITEKPNAEVFKIYGYCDWKGTNKYNDALSLKRVNSVYDYLKQNKVAINKDYFSKGYGEDFKQSKNQELNRKVIILFEDKKNTLSTIVENSKVGQKIKLENINFYNNSDKILPQSESNLGGLLQVMVDNPTLKIEIQGYICCQKNGDINDISTARAKAIYEFLINNEIDKNRLSYKGFGSTQPIYPLPELSELERVANRRVEILILEK